MRELKMMYDIVEYDNTQQVKIYDLLYTTISNVFYITEKIKNEKEITKINKIISDIIFVLDCKKKDFNLSQDELILIEELFNKFNDMSFKFNE